MHNETAIDVAHIGKGNTIKHPQTGEWVKTAQVVHGKTGVMSTRPGESHEHINVWVTLENGEKLEFDGGDKVIRKD